jgi:VWFA-related protein
MMAASIKPLNKTGGAGILLSLFFALIFTLPSLAQDPDPTQDRIVEKVTVTNVEVPVRVLYKGKPVAGLSKDDFIIYENKKQMAINGFFVKQKKISVTGKDQVLTPGKEPRPRAFVLVFSITDFNDNLVKAVDHLFANVLRPNDRLMIFANDVVVTHPNISDGATIKQQLLGHLRTESMKARRRLIKYIHEIETYLNMHEFRVALQRRTDLPRELISFLRKYLLTWNQYKKRYLTPRIDRFYYFSRYLENLNAEKWVFNFYQFDLFPQIRFSSTTMDAIREISSQLLNSSEAGQHSIGRMILNLINQITIDLNVNKGVPTEEISKLFHKVDATFHSFFIRGINRLAMNDFEFNEVASQIEDTLKEITDVTGGRNITSNDLVKSIDTVSELSDTYYLLTYVPADPNKAGKLKIKVKNKKYKTYYDDNFRADWIAGYLKKLEKNLDIPEIKIRDFSFKQKILVFTIAGYLMKEPEAEKAKTGRLQVRIRVTDKENKPLFDEVKALSAQKAKMKITLETFKHIKKGEYNFLIDAVDLITGRKTNFHQNIIIQ